MSELATKGWVKDLLGKIFKESPASVNKELNKYSADEQVVGTWIDGRPIYRRTIQTTSNATSGTQSNYTLDFSLQNCLSITGYLLLADGYTHVPIFYYATSSAYFTVIARGNGHPNNPNTLGITVAGASNWLSRPIYLTIEYTKTTDAATS